MDHTKECWVSVTSMSGQKYIGRARLGQDKKELLAKLTRESWLHLQPAFEFYAPLQVDRNGAAARQALTAPVEMTSDEELGHYIQIVEIRFFEDMNDSDRKTYEDLVRRVREQLHAIKAQRAGIQLMKNLT